MGYVFMYGVAILGVIVFITYSSLKRLHSNNHES